MGRGKVHVYVNRQAGQAVLPGVIKTTAKGERIEAKEEKKKEMRPASPEEMKEILDNVYNGKKKSAKAKMGEAKKAGIGAKGQKPLFSAPPLPGPEEKDGDEVFHRPNIGDVLHAHMLMQMQEQPGKVVGGIKANYEGILSAMKPIALAEETKIAGKEKEGDEDESIIIPDAESESAKGGEIPDSIGGQKPLPIEEVEKQIALSPYIDQKDPQQVLEAALFMSGQSVSSVELGKLVGIAAVGKVQDMMAKLSEKYEKNGSAIEITEENTGKWVMRIKADYAPAVRQFAGEAEISKHALKTLAYVSKNNGIKKRDLFKRLGGGIYEDVAELEEKGFLHSKPSGRTKSLHTSDKFRQYFQG